MEVNGQYSNSTRYLEINPEIPTRNEIYLQLLIKI